MQSKLELTVTPPCGMPMAFHEPRTSLRNLDQHLARQSAGLREGRYFLEQLVEHTTLQWVYVLDFLGARQICAKAQNLNSSDLSLSLRLCLVHPFQ